MAEAIDSKPIQCRFESDHRYMKLFWTYAGYVVGAVVFTAVLYLIAYGLYVLFG